MTRRQIKDVLLNDGWREYKSQTHCTDIYTKNFPSRYNCCCNDHIDGINIELRSMADDRNLDDASIALHIRGQIKDGSWVHFQNYGISRDLYECLKKIPGLINIWEFSMEA